MKKLYILLLMLLLLFIPTSVNAVAVYQLDQPVRELNNHTLREVFDEGNITINPKFNGTPPTNWIQANLTPPLNVSNGYIGSSTIVENASIGQTSGTLSLITGNTYYQRYTFDNPTNNATYHIRVLKIGGNDYYGSNIFSVGIHSISAQFVLPNDFVGLRLEVLNMTLGLELRMKSPLLINQTSLGITSLTVEQMDTYYHLYLEAVRYEQENKEAVKDEGNYKHIFMSIYEGLTNLMKSMGSVWTFLSTPIINSNITQMGQLFNIDWSWNIFDIFRQLITDLALFVLQLNTYIVSSLFFALGIPIKISILSLVFSDFVFVVLTWIIFKSFII